MNDATIPPREPARSSSAQGSNTPSDWRKTFLAVLAETSNVSASARRAKVDLSTVYRTRRAEPDFAHEWQVALSEGYDNLEMELLRRLRSGDRESPTAKSKRKFDNATALRLLAAHRESAARQRALGSQADEAAIIASINAKLDRMRERERDVTRTIAEDGMTKVIDKPGAWPAARDGEDGSDRDEA